MDDNQKKNLICVCIVALAAILILAIVSPIILLAIVAILIYCIALLIPHSLPHSYYDVGRDLAPIAIGVVAFWLGYNGFLARLVGSGPSEYYNEGIKSSANGDYETALKLYDHSIAMNEKDADVWNNKSYVLTKLGRYDEAIVAGERAVQLSPSDIDIHHTLEEAIAAKKKQV